MVKIKSFFAIPFMLLLSWSSLVLAEPSLQVQLKKTSGELGRPVYIKIIGQGLSSDLSLLSLQSLKKQFFLDSKDLDTEMVIDNSTNDKQNNIHARRQILSLKLYPRQTGELLIAPLSIDKISSSEQKLIIHDASTKGEKITLDWTISSTSVWQREQIIVSLTITTPEEFASIKLEQQSIYGFEITPLPVNRQWRESSLGGKSIITAGWSLLPLNSGKIEIDLPAIEYHLSGVIRRAFYLPEVKLNIRPLASYLPPTIPVGKLKVESTIKPAGMLKTNDLAYWNISIESKSLTPYWLPPLLRQIKSNDNIQFFPAASKRSMHPDSQGTNARVSHSIPFKPLNNGLTDLPDITLQYFDPVTGRLESLLQKTERPIATSVTLRVLVSIILLAVAIYLCKIIYQYLQNRVKYRHQRLNALMLIKQANTKEEVLAGLRLLGKAEGWPDNLTLSEWLKRWQEKYLLKPQLEACIQTLSSFCYGRVEKDNLQIIKSSLIELLDTPR